MNGAWAATRGVWAVSGREEVVDRVERWLQTLTADQMERYFLGLFGIGLLLCLWLVYSIYRRTEGVAMIEDDPEPSHERPLPPLVVPAPDPADPDGARGSRPERR